MHYELLQAVRDAIWPSHDQRLRCWILVADGPWQPPSGSLGHLRLDGRIELKYGPVGHIADEISWESPEGVRFAGQLPSSQVDPETADSIMTAYESFFLLRHESRPIPTKEIVHAAFMERDRWIRRVMPDPVVRLARTHNAVVGFWTGGFDDPEISLDMLGDSATLDEVFQLVSG